MIAEPECSKRKCKWFQGVKKLGKLEATEVVYCKAYPKGIPNVIAYGSNKHTKIRDDQKGKYIYKKREEKPVASRESRYIDDDLIPFEVVPRYTGTKQFQEEYADFADDMVGEPICFDCKHSHNDGTCDAFPNGVPLEILSGAVNHFLPYEGDHGIQYEVEEEEE